MSAGEPLVELETDKIDLEVAAPKAGVLSRIAHGDGADVKVGEVLGVIDEGEAGAQTAPANRQPETVSERPEAGSRKPEAGSQKPEADSRQPAAGSSEPPPGTDKTRATPAAKNVAAKNAVDLKQGAGYR